MTYRAKLVAMSAKLGSCWGTNYIHVPAQDTENRPMFPLLSRPEASVEDLVVHLKGGCAAARAVGGRVQKVKERAVPSPMQQLGG